MGIQGDMVREAVYAGFWLRLVAATMDGLVLWIPGSAFRWIFGKDAMPPLLFESLDFLQSLVLWTLYYGFLESSKWQGTVGKMILKLQVTDMERKRISFARACGRFLGQLISALPCGMGFLMIAWTRRKQGLHDMMAGCLVVRKGRYGTVRAVKESGSSLGSLLSRLVGMIRNIVTGR